MQRLSLITLFSLFGLICLGQNPHGEDLIIDCKACHNSGSWSFSQDSSMFLHGSTGFNLEGQHAKTDCKLCHSSLIFSEVDPTCASCHTDVHNMSVGNDCVRCHDANNWLVDNIPELHEQNGFPLLGQHRMVSCVDCHKSESNLRWDRIGNDCSSCHIDDYNTTTNPNHAVSGFSTNCTECHEPTAQNWGAENFHFFFPLTGKHDVADCNACHKTNNYSDASPECISCHQEDYNNANCPDHNSSGFSTDCTLCHQGDAWTPASFTQHDGQYFPIYSGEHRGAWSSCVECHTTPGSYNTFSCIDCHEHSNASRLAGEHDDVSGYVFESNACYSCHPTGDD